MCVFSVSAELQPKRVPRRIAESQYRQHLWHRIPPLPLFWEPTDSAPPKASLPFGKRAQILPWPLEALCFSFLPIDGLGAVWLTCQALRGAVVRFFRELRVLRWDLANSIRINLAAIHCCSLSRIEASEGIINDLVFTACLRVVERNTATLRAVHLQPRLFPSAPWPWYAAEIFFACPLLEHIDLSSNRSQIPDRVLDLLLTKTNLSHLRSVRIGSPESTYLQGNARLQAIFDAGMRTCFPGC